MPKFAHMCNDIYRIVTKHIATQHTNQNLFLFLVTYIKKNGLFSELILYQLRTTHEDENKKELKIIILHLNNS